MFYWTYKFLLLKHFKRTNLFKELLPLSSVKYMRVGIVLHLVFGSILLTNTEIIPRQKEDFSLVERINQWDMFKNNQNFADLASRITLSNHGVIYLFSAISIVLLIVATNLLRILIPAMKACFKFCLIAKNKQETEVELEQNEDETESNDFYKEVQLPFLTLLQEKSLLEVWKLEQYLSKHGGVTKINNDCAEFRFANEIKCHKHVDRKLIYRSE